MPSLLLDEMSRRTFAGIGTNLSGTYNVRETELYQSRHRTPISTSSINTTTNTGNAARRNTSGIRSLSGAAMAAAAAAGAVAAASLNKPSVKTIKCVVHFLDNTQHTFDIDKRAKGECILDLVFRHLELVEKDYFGLQYSESKSHLGHTFISSQFFHLHTSTFGGQSSSHSSGNSSEVFKWLDPSKPIRKQLRSEPPYTLHFRVRFYVSEPSKLQEEYTRYHLFLQLRRDLLDKRLSLPHSSAVLLASYAVQSELGDFSSEEHKPGYLSDLQLLPSQTAEVEREISELHKLHRGQTPADAELNFLEHAKTLDFYGIELHKAMDISGDDIDIGVGGQGIVIFESGYRVNTFSWSRIVKICFKRKHFFVQMRPTEDDNSSSESIVGFNLNSYSQCKALWKSCVEHHTFFRLQSPKPHTKKFFFFFTLGSRFRYSGKTEFQTLEESRQRARPDRNFVRSSSRRYIRQTVPSMHIVRSPNTQESNGFNSPIRCPTTHTQHPSTCSSSTSAPDCKKNGALPNNHHSSIRSAASFWFSSTTSKLLQGISSSVVKLNASRRANNRSTTSNRDTRTSSVSSSADKTTIPGQRSNAVHVAYRSGNSSVGRSGSMFLSSRSVRTGNRSVSTGNVQPMSRRWPQRQSLGNLVSSGISLHPNGSALNAVPSSTVDSWSISRTISRTVDFDQQMSNDSAYVGSIRRSSMHHLTGNSGARNQVTERCSLVPKPAWTHDNISSLDGVKPVSGATGSSSLTTSVACITSTGTIVSSSISNNNFNAISNDNHVANSISAGALPVPVQTSTSLNVSTSAGLSNVACRSHSAVPLSRSSGPSAESAQLSNQILDTLIAASASHHANLKQMRLRLLGNESSLSGGQQAAVQPAHNSLTIAVRIHPDDQGRFGFNVKGGADQSLPVLVSRVAPNTPADACVPKLNEGDQVLSVNGSSVDGLTHEQVVKLIRCTKDRLDGGELLLTIRPNVFNSKACADSERSMEDDEPTFQYIPVDASPATRNKSQCDKLHQSIMLLYEGLESEALIDQFEKLYLKKPDEKMLVAKMPSNLNKNRYRDISPYDSTRVILTDNPSGDYINASFVNMEVPTSGIVNRYIATQGPLSNTCDDFWQMVWEQKSALIIMVTPLVERGSIKCFKYWPELGETQTFNEAIQTTCTRQVETSSLIEREFRLLRNGEERICTHIQYLAWPDHGVPDDPMQFLELIFKVRQYRCGLVEPIIVHCSAGIGRTGVLILMETAMCLIEANEPIYPLEILKIMRDQRASLIQTSSQFKFVLEAICKVYKERLVKPQYEKR